MNNNKAIIDNDFLDKVVNAPKNSDGKDLFKRTMRELNVTPVINFYVAQHEVMENSKCKELINEGYIQVIQPRDFLDMENTESYCETIKSWYRQYNGERVPVEADMLKFHSGGKSLGEMHSLLMAAYMNLPFFLSDDGDAKEIAEDKIESSKTTIKVLNLIDVYIEIGQKKTKNISLEEVRNVIQCEDKHDGIGTKRSKKERYKTVKDKWII